MMRRLLPLTALLLLTACDVAAPAGNHPDATVPTPTWAPTPSHTPAGTTVRVPSGPTGLAIKGDGLAVIAKDAAFVRREPATSVTSVTVDGSPSAVATGSDGYRLVVGASVVTVAADGTTGAAWPLPAEGGAIAVPPTGDWTAVALPTTGDVIILSATGATTRTIHTGGRPSALAADKERIAVLDFTESSLTVYDAATGARQEALRAGDGAAAVTTAGDGRFAVVDARDGELLVFETGPLLLRQRYPVPGGPWALAHDAGRDVLWVTVTQRNEVVGYDVTGGTPREVARHATVRLPLAVAVDPRTGTLAVAGSDASAPEGLVQRIPA
ncbi:hypothetical protein AB0M46_26435 [Dactylosporangium sp. NPDC051485]|uniref:YncE family protein n=1 Tax=Dactylosporangium sp. NPDC051485 TaxID=3154846 RepID=UPI00341EDE78